MIIKTIIKAVAICFFSGISYAGISIGHITISNPDIGSQDVTYERVNNYALVEGDIIIGKISELDKPGAVIRSRLGGSRWRHGIIPFEISEDLPLPNKLAILEAVNHWQKHTWLEFIEITSANRGKFKDYIAFIPAPGTTCSSYVGRLGGRQEINLSTRCTAMNTVHEIGHALGLWHEQSRTDRSNYIQIVWENIDDDHRFNFEQHFNDGRDFGEYDYQSIMHYGPYAFSKNGGKTIIPLVEGVEIGQRRGLSEKDIAVVKAMYPEV
ncbi:Dot/Icm T4SS effector Zinc-dependent metalloprotease LegP [Legionella dresdenensis]|uniref:Dot/Icm T4SS effector Zinc-dependent metalloprotease LegP n=1 Tax=Legionella dresdenensis TaxID=450200 RepID=A0ABV8CD35_9GAMM